MTGYTKLFTEILGSTIWQEDAATRLVWITMLVLKDRDQVVHCSIPGLADFAKVGLESCESALEKLMAPDKYSRSKEFQGRRIEEVDGGWKVLNGEKYRDKLSLEERREYKRIKAIEYRKRKKDLGELAVKNGAKEAIVEGFKHYNGENS